MYNFQSRKGAHQLAAFLKPLASEQNTAYLRHRFAHSKRFSYSVMGGQGHPVEVLGTIL